MGSFTLTLTNAVGPQSTTIFKASSGIVDDSVHPSIPIRTFGTPPAFSLERNFLQANPISAQFSTANVPFDWPVEAQLYARDPDELGQFADTLETESTRVRSQLMTIAGIVTPHGTPFATQDRDTFDYSAIGETVTLPDALSILSPAIPAAIESGGLHGPVYLNNGINASVQPVTPSDFFGSQTPYDAVPDYLPRTFLENDWFDPTLQIAAGPTGSGSVKAARVTYPGICTYERLFAPSVRPDAQYRSNSPSTLDLGLPGDTPGVTGTNHHTPLDHIYAQFDDAIGTALTSLCTNTNDLQVIGITGVPIPRSTGLSTDSVGQYLFNVELVGSSSGTFAAGFGHASAWSCHVTATILYDIKLDVHGAVVFDIAPLPPVAADNPHGLPQTNGTEFVGRDYFKPQQWTWVDNSGQATTGSAAVAINDYGGGYCHDFNAGDLAVSGPGKGLDDWVQWFLTMYLRQRINDSLRTFQMFPRIGSFGADPNWGLRSTDGGQGGLVNPALWTCDPTNARPDPQGHVRAPRGKSFAVQNPLATSEPLGFGFLTPVPQTGPIANCANASGACGKAMCDFCNMVRLGFARRVLSSQSTTFGGCFVQPNDDYRLAMLLQSVVATDTFTNLAQWGCAGTDPGNQPCSPTTPGLACPGLKQCVSRTLPLPVGSHSARLPYCQNNNVDFLPDPCYGCTPSLSAGTCYFTPPVRRLIVNPDGLQYVFFDNEDDWTNASLAFKYALIGYGANQNNVIAINPLAQAYLPKGNQPFALCNYDRLNDVESNAPVHIPDPAPTERQIDSYGHLVRDYTFPRPFAVYAVNAVSDLGIGLGIGQCVRSRPQE